MDIEILRKNGEILLSLDFGEIYFTPDRSESKILKFVNKFDHDAKVRILVAESSEKFPAKLKLIAIDDISTVDESFKEMAAEIPQDDIYCPANSSINVLVILTADVTSTSQVYTSYHYITATATFQTYQILQNDDSPQIVQSYNIPISANICASILYIDETDVEFEATIGNTYFRDIQIWNRSESKLFYRFLYLNGTKHMNSMLTFSEPESGKTLQFGKTLLMLPFATKRVRCTMKARILGEHKATYVVENLNNSSNTMSINCGAFVKEADDSEGVSIEMESGEALGSGQVLDLGDCYTGLVVMKRLWLRNKSTDTIHLSLSSDHPEELSFDLSGHLEDVNISSLQLQQLASIQQGMSAPPTATSLMQPTVSFQARAQGYGLSNVANAPSSVPAELSKTEDDDDDDDIRSPGSLRHTRSSFGSVSVKTSAFIGSDQDAWSSRSQGTCLSAGYSFWGKDSDADESDDRLLGGRRFFLCLDNTRSDSFTESKVNPTAAKGAVNKEALFSGLPYEPRPSLFKGLDGIRDPPSNRRAINSRGRSEEVVLKPGARIPLTLQYCPLATVYSERRSRSGSSWSLLPDAVAQEGSPTVAPGSLAAKRLKLYLRWNSRAEWQDGRGDERGTEYSGALEFNGSILPSTHPPVTYTRSLTCRARCIV